MAKQFQRPTHLITQQTVGHLVLFFLSESPASGLGVCGGRVGHHGAAGGQGVYVGGWGTGEDQGGGNGVQHGPAAHHLLPTYKHNCLPQTSELPALHSYMLPQLDSHHPTNKTNLFNMNMHTLLCIQIILKT